MAGLAKSERRGKAKATRPASKASLKDKSMQLATDIRQLIADKAYGLYEQRGKREGYALDDWLDAEYLVKKEIYKAR